jgi:hypothetical protein
MWFKLFVLLSIPISVYILLGRLFCIIGGAWTLPNAAPGTGPASNATSRQKPNTKIHSALGAAIRESAGRIAP